MISIVISDYDKLSFFEFAEGYSKQVYQAPILQSIPYKIVQER